MYDSFTFHYRSRNKSLCRVLFDAGPIIGTTSPMVIGYSGGSKYFKGYIDNVSMTHQVM